jgi:hypothetical protein
MWVTGSFWEFMSFAKAELQNGHILKSTGPMRWHSVAPVSASDILSEFTGPIQCLPGIAGGITNHC